MHILSVLAAVLGATLGARLLRAGRRPTGRLPRALDNASRRWPLALVVPVLLAAALARDLFVWYPLPYAFAATGLAGLLAIPLAARGIRSWPETLLAVTEVLAVAAIPMMILPALFGAVQWVGLPRWPLYFAAGAILTRVFTLALWLCGNRSRQAYPPQFAGLLAAAVLVLAALAGSA